MERREFETLVERRQGPPRDACRIKAVLTAPGPKTFACTITDISPTGAKLAVDAACALPSTFNLVIPIDKGLDETRRCELRWRIGGRTGVRFVVV